MSACKGTIWRYIENGFINAKGEIVIQKRVRKLKRKCCNQSCQPSHNACASEFDDELISEYFSGADCLPDLPENVRNGDELILRYDANEDEIEAVWFDKVEND